MILITFINDNWFKFKDVFEPKLLFGFNNYLDKAIMAKNVSFISF